MGDDITDLLQRAHAGDRPALDRLLPLIYGELHRLAHAQQLNTPATLLDTTALVHEAYLKLAGQLNLSWPDRRHFYAYAARAMRSILVDNARRRGSDKRGGGALRDDDALERLQVRDESDLLAVDQALGRLAKISDRLRSAFAENTANSGAAFQISASAAGQQTTSKNSLFAANTGAGGNCQFGGGTVTVVGNNLSTDSTCNGFDFGSTDARLLPFEDNGGPTWTYGLQTTSPAVDAVVDCTDTNGFALTTDQRGFVRPVALHDTADPRCDIGAYELGEGIFKDGFDPSGIGS
jgi:RNA polymerase sigma factor (TIGR02999 family)